jgi:hypothetical protein
MVQKYQGKSDSQIESDWTIIINGQPGPGDWQYYHDCWFVDGEYPWDNEVQTRVNARYMKGWSTKDPFAIDHQPGESYAKPIKPRKERRILNA